MSSNPILITGATGGIGTDLCHHLAEKKYSLILSARNEERLLELSTELEKEYGINHSILVHDFSSDTNQGIDDLMSSLRRPLGGLVLMPPQDKPTTDFYPSNESWMETFKNGFIGPLALLKQCTPHLEKADKSKVVIISGISSKQVLSHYAKSNVLRTMWVGQAKTMAHALGPKGISVNTLSVGGVLTEKYRDRLSKKASDKNRTFEEQMDEEVSNVPLRKYATTKDVANAVEGLLSSFSDHITGVNITCDGGFTRAY